MKVLFIPSWYPSYFGELTGSYIFDLAQSLNERNVDVDVVYCDFKNFLKLDVNELFQYLGGIVCTDECGVKTIRYKSMRFPKSVYSTDWRWIKKSYKLVEHYITKFGKPDLIHAHSVMWGGEVANLIAQTYNIPYVITEHRGRFVQGSGVIINKRILGRINNIVKNAELLMPVSEALNPFFNQFDVKRLKIVPNYVEDIFFSTPLKKRDPSKEHLILSTVCHLTAEKNIKMLIEAFSLLSKDYPNLMLKVGGSGKEKRPLESYVKNLGLAERVSFLGKLSRIEVRNLLQESDVFVLPSSFESFGIVYIEAISQGVPVIGTNVGGPKYFINEKVGKLTNPDDLKELRTRIHEVILNLDKYNPCNLREFTVKHFSKEKIIGKIINVYKDIC